MAKSKRKQLKKKLLHKYRLVALNEDTFEEMISFKLNRLNVFVFVTLFILVLIAGTTVLIAFTPLREYIPGYSSAKLEKDVTNLIYEVDSLENELSTNEVYYSRIQKVLKGEIEVINMNRDSLFETFKQDTTGIDLAPSRQDSLLRKEVALEDKYSLFESSESKLNSVLFPPVKGTISQDYNSKDGHFAIDVVAVIDTPVKSVADGTVIFAEWSAETGFVCIIEHGQGLISVYKHNSALTKKQGDLVKAGEVIAAIGNTGEHTSGPHLHFELWSDGYPVNPINYIDFE
jgi:murein DD-endopeptidase MepM/ murein hydrolase activator NlpD